MTDDSNRHHADSGRIDNQRTVDSSPRLDTDSLNRKDSSSVPVDATGRYELKDEIARGGMGVIVHSRDKELQRDLAIKFLRRSKAEQPGASLRFLEEAQIAGQLQHPGIVPIYDVGELEDGRPFFSMKLVKGQTLAELLKERSFIGQDLTRYLGIFEQVCQAVAYAHSRNVIHRDLKPANIMVGAFGEVQVMDWGLAKVVGAELSLDDLLNIAPSDSPESSLIDLYCETHDSSIRTTRDVKLEAGMASSDLEAYTQLGSVVGTLAYMPPEQALGQADLIDTGVDVFALGAILACILTGSPPYVSTSKSLQLMAEQGDLTDCYQRIESSGCDLRLQAILRAALAPQKADRTLDASTLAMDISGYIASVSDRLNDVKVESATAKAREEEAVKASVRVQRRSNIAMAMAGIAILASFLAGFGAFVAQWNQTARLDAEKASRVVTAEFEADSSKRQQLAIRELRTQLAVCDSLLQQSLGRSARRPSDYSVQRIKKTMASIARRLEQDSDLNLVSGELWQSHRLLADRLSTLQSAIHLVDGLEAHRAALIANELDGSDHHHFFAGRPEKVVVSKEQVHSAQLYKLFSVWLDSFAVDNRQHAADKILQMPPWAQPPIIDGLKQLQLSYRAADSGMLASTATWHALEMTGHETNGAILSPLSDGSILASGPIPDGEEYRLTFSSDVNQFSALKIEALTDPSLPMLGPGRSQEGDFTICWMAFDLAARDATFTGNDAHSDALDFFEPNFREAFTTFQSPQSEFDANHWHCVMAPSKDQHTILFLDEPVKSLGGFSVKLLLKFNERGPWGDQSLGRFRVSVASVPARSAIAAFAAEVGQIADKVIAGRANAWEQEYWRVREESKDDALVAELLALASMTDFEQQHSIYSIGLAETLKEQSEPWWIAEMNRQFRWHTIAPEENHSNIPTERLADGSWLVGRTDQSNSRVTGTYQHTFRFRTPRPITHLKFESMRDETLPNGGPGRGVGTGEFSISRLSLIRNGQPTTFDTARSNFPTSVDTDISRASDSDSLTFWSPHHPVSAPVRTAIFSVSNQDRKEGLLEYEVVIVSGRPSTSAHDSVGRFKISWCDCAVDVASQYPADVAMKILDDQYMRDPGNYGTLVSLARAAALKNPPDHESAANYGWTAYALKPQDTNSISIAVRTILRRNPAPGSAELARAILLARKAKAIDFKSGVIEQVFAQQIEVANAHYGQQQYQQAELAYRTAHDLIPDNFPIPGRWGDCLTEVGELEYAQQVMLERYRRDPDNAWLRVHLTHNAIVRKDFDLAEEYIDPVVTNHPKNLVALMLKVQLAEKRGSFLEVIRLLESHKDVAPLTAEGTGYLYRALYANSKISEVANELPAAFLNWPEATELHHCICLIMTACGQIDQLDDSLQRLKEIRPDQLDHIIERVFLDEVKVSEVKKPSAFDFCSLDTIERFYKSAVEVHPDSSTLNRLKFIIDLKKQKWESVIEEIDGGSIIQSRFSLLAKAWCQFELGNRSLAGDLVEQSMTADANHRPHELRWLRNQLKISAREPDSSILQIFGPAIQMVASKP